ncbi:MAG: hypothetical protein GYA21_05580 [Myxococcales bacterium]|nr:hypothetical protein [Myxococcales bacterium]
MMGREHRILIFLLGVMLLAAPLALPAPDSDPIASRLLGQDAASSGTWVGEIPVGSEFQAHGPVRPVLSAAGLSLVSADRAARLRPSRLPAEHINLGIPTLHRVKFFLRLGVGRDSSDEPS